ncbi:hypothetical protein SLA2020_150680 [Shorea laevis]
MTQLPKRVHLTLTQNNLQELKDIYDGWPTDRRCEFYLKFGHIGFLLSTPIDEAMLRAAIHFWDPRYRVFVFGEVDMTPTHEEYAVLLRMPSATSGKIYKPDAGYGFKRKLAKIMGIEVQDLEGLIKNNGESEGIPWYVLRDVILGNPDNRVRLNVFALAIYGLVLFPKALGYVDGKIVNLFEQLLDNANPIPAILAETFRSLNHCRINGQGRFTGCAQLLTIWLKSHFECLHSEFKDPNVGDRFPVEEFKMSTWPRAMSRRAWMEKLQTVTATNVIWKAPWMDRPPLLYRCGNYSWVPLLGLWGAIAYAPALVRRQIGSLQFMPVTYQLDTFEFAYGIPGTRKFIFEVCEAWKNIHRVAAGAYTNSTTPGYPEWRANRLSGLVIPEPFEPERDDETDDLYEEREMHYKAAMTELQEENAALASEKVFLLNELRVLRAQAQERIEWENYMLKHNNMLQESLEELITRNRALENQVMEARSHRDRLEEERNQWEKAAEYWKGESIKKDCKAYQFVNYLREVAAEARNMEEEALVLKAGIGLGSLSGGRVEAFLKKAYQQYKYVGQFH